MSFIELGQCYVCENVFKYNALLVPKINGSPLCQECVEYANPRRVAKGLTPIRIYPETYGENWKFQFNAKAEGIMTPEKPQVVRGWVEKPDVHRFGADVYWDVKLFIQEPEDSISFTGKVED